MTLLGKYGQRSARSGGSGGRRHRDGVRVRGRGRPDRTRLGGTQPRETAPLDDGLRRVPYQRVHSQPTAATRIRHHGRELPGVIAPWHRRQGAGGRGLVLLWWALPWAVLPEPGVDALRFGELVFQDDDAAGRLHRGALVNQVAGALGQAQLVARVAAVPAGRALRDDQPCGVQAAQERGGDIQHLRGAAHAVGRVILVLELVFKPVVGAVVRGVPRCVPI